MINPSFWKDKRVFVTGHTGFKGGWICLWLKHLGAEVIGYSLEPATVPSLFEVADVDDAVRVFLCVCLCAYARVNVCVCLVDSLLFIGT